MHSAPLMGGMDSMGPIFPIVSTCMLYCIDQNQMVLALIPICGGMYCTAFGPCPWHRPTGPLLSMSVYVCKACIHVCCIFICIMYMYVMKCCVASH